MKKAKKQYTVLLADNNRDYLRMIRDYLKETEKFDVVDFAFDGEKAVELTIQHRPDLLIIDLILPVMDCFAVLEAVCKSGYDKNTKVVMTSAVGLDFVMKKAESYGVDYIFLKPFDKEVFQKRVLEIMAFTDIKAQEFSVGKCKNATDIITRHIKMVGITANVKGYYYLRDAILFVHDDFSLMSRLTTDLYVRIAQKYDSTPSRVERAMRHAIETAFGRANIDVLESFFGYTIDETKGKPTNGEFIAMLADKLANELKYVD